MLFSDPMMRLLAAAVAGALLLPVRGQGAEVAGWVANGAVFVLFLMNGMKIARREVLAGFRNWRFLVPLCLWVFGAMALAGLGLARLALGVLPASLALGFLFLGTLTSTVQSATSYSSLAGGNAALSVVSAALLNILGVFVTVPLFLALGGPVAGDGGGETILRIVLLLLVPFAIGQAVQSRTATFVARHRGAIAWLDRLVIATAVYVAFSGAVSQGIGSRVGGSDWVWLTVLTGAFIAFAHGGAWTASALLRLPRRDRIAFLFAGAQKSVAVGAPLATLIFSSADAGFVVMPLLLYHLLTLVVAAPLATLLASAHPRDDDGCSAPTTTATARSGSPR